MSLLFRYFLLCAICTCSALPSSVASAEYTGFKRLLVTNPVSGKAMDAVYFYPGVAAEKIPSTIGPYQIAAQKALNIVPGRYPVIVISHGNAGSLWSHHDLATTLARQGNIVITLTHPGDNYKDQTGAGAISSWYGRPLQISAVITAATNDVKLAKYIDEDKIAFIGFSAGGATGLLLRGGEVDAGRYGNYCRKHEMKAICSTKGVIINDHPGLVVHLDSRIKAWVFMAPVSMAFSPGSLRRVIAPTLIFTGDKDEELSWEENARELATTLAAEKEFQVIHNAGHFVFLSPCSAELNEMAPAICNDAPGINRENIHAVINSKISEFLSRAWLKVKEPRV
ncbi:alpha/beta hydrolase family protein [Aeromonas dhakensis]|uniref:alpha/beta hydrolase family protein n=1 Tax=Aeromonas dhakensis TaxID=196024 RepID=UPI00236621B4|nr:dienelactone hydrolase [Aeromonas dhakensis]WDF94142.1 dienelactone hydrolase [Aeromonas dhakensis]